MMDNFKYNEDGSVDVVCKLYNSEDKVCAWASCPLKLIEDDPRKYTCFSGIFKVSWTDYIKFKRFL